MSGRQPPSPSTPAGFYSGVKSFVLNSRFVFTQLVCIVKIKGPFFGEEVPKVDGNEEDFGSELHIKHIQESPNSPKRIYEISINRKKEPSIRIFLSDVIRFQSTKKLLIVNLTEDGSIIHLKFPTERDRSVLERFFQSHMERSTLSKDSNEKEDVVENKIGSPITEQFFNKKFPVPRPYPGNWTSEEYLSWMNLIPAPYYFSPKKSSSIYDFLKENKPEMIKKILSLNKNSFKEMRRSFDITKEDNIFEKDMKVFVQRHYSYLERYFKNTFNPHFYTILRKLTPPDFEEIRSLEWLFLSDSAYMWNLDELCDRILFSLVTGQDIDAWIGDKINFFKDFSESPENEDLTVLERLEMFEEIHDVDMKIFCPDTLDEYHRAIGKKSPLSKLISEVSSNQIFLEKLNSSEEEKDEQQQQKVDEEDNNFELENRIEFYEAKFLKISEQLSLEKILLYREGIKKKIREMIEKGLKEMLEEGVDLRIRFGLSRRREENDTETTTTEKKKKKKKKKQKKKKKKNNLGKLFSSSSIPKFGNLHSYCVLCNVEIHWMDIIGDNKGTTYVSGVEKHSTVSDLMEPFDGICLFDVTCPKSYNKTQLIEFVRKISTCIINCNINEEITSGFSNHDFSLLLLSKMGAVFPLYKEEEEFIKQVRNLKKKIKKIKQKISTSSVEEESEGESEEEKDYYLQYLDLPQGIPEELEKKYYYNEQVVNKKKRKKKRLVIKNHKELDELVLDFQKLIPSFQTKFPGVYSLLRGFDRAFWMMKKRGKRDERLYPKMKAFTFSSLGGNRKMKKQEIQCPFYEKKSDQEKYGNDITNDIFDFW